MDSLEKKVGKSIAKFVLPPLVLAATSLGAMAVNNPAVTNPNLPATQTTCSIQNNYTYDGPIRGFADWNARNRGSYTISCTLIPPTPPALPAAPAESTFSLRTAYAMPSVSYSFLNGPAVEFGFGLGEIRGNKNVVGEVTGFVNGQEILSWIGFDLNSLGLKTGYTGDAYGASIGLNAYKKWTEDLGAHFFGIDGRLGGILSMAPEGNNIFWTGSIGVKVGYPYIGGGVRATWILEKTNFTGKADSEILDYARRGEPFIEAYIFFPWPFKI